MSELAVKAGVSRDLLYLLERGQSVSVESAIRVVNALGLRLEVDLIDPRKRVDRPAWTADSVHSFMGEIEAGHFRPLKFAVGIDEPYQHYQYAGRADFVAWDVDELALLHIENRTRFPDMQETAGSFNAKREYLGRALAERAGIRRWESETHVIAALWSTEVLHVMRMRPETFRSLSPNGSDAFSAWWAGTPPARGRTASIIVLDPLASGRQRRWISLEEALAGARPRHRGYADVAAKLASQT